MQAVRDFGKWFFEWYERHYRLNISIAAGLFLLQIVHLLWLTLDPLATKGLGEPIYDLESAFRWVIVLIDYTEIPALVSVSLVYVNELRKGFNWKSVAYLVFLNSQWLHIFWITDEFVVGTTEGAASTLPVWLAWVAILIDYLELPVIVDTLRKMAAATREGRLGQYLATELE